MKFPETSRWNLVGIESHSVESGWQPEASLASSVVRPIAKPTLLRTVPAATVSNHAIEPRNLGRRSPRI